MTAPITLTAKQVDYLKACARGPQSPWSAGSTTVSVLKKAGLIHIPPNGWRYIATDAGRAWLTSQGGNDGRE